VAEPGEQDAVREIVHRPDAPGDDQLSVAEVDIVETHPSDGPDAGGVHRGEGQ
jgi:hypothetical protein